MTFLAVSQALSWLIILGLAFVVLSLARQIGLLHERIAPVGALITDTGPAIGQFLPATPMRTLDDLPITLAGAIASSAARPAMRLLLFVAADCPICKRIIGLADSLAGTEGVQLFLIGDGPADPLRAMRARLGVAHLPFANGADIGLALQIGRLPYAVLLDPAGTIRAKGLVNTREHLESLLVAHETGHPDVQSYLAHTEVLHAAE